MSRISFLKTILAAGVLTLGAMTAQAATFTFDFTGLSGIPRTSLGFSQGGLDLTVTADHFRPADKALLGGGLITRNAGGLGEKTGTEDPSANAVEGVGIKEILFFTFSKKVLIKSIGFADIASGSQAAAYLDGAFWINGAVQPLVDITAFNKEATSIGLGAVTTRTSFLVSSITVASVPLPAGGLLLASALALPLLRRKRRS